MPSPERTAALHAAIVPLAAYVARTPAGNRHADAVAAAVDAVADYVEDSEAADATRAAEPDWKALAYRMAERLPDPPGYQPAPLLLRCRALLDSPRAKARAALPLAQRMALAQINSHHLGTPDSI